MQISVSPYLFHLWQYLLFLKYCLLSILFGYITSFFVYGYAAVLRVFNLWMQIRHINFVRDATTKGVVVGGYFVFSLGTIYDFVLKFSSR